MGKRRKGYYWAKMDGEHQPVRWVGGPQNLWMIFGSNAYLTTRQLKHVFSDFEIGDEILPPTATQAEG